jgi:hypothetical protein
LFRRELSHGIVHPQDLVALLGRNNIDPLVEAALRHYAVRNRPKVKIDEDDPDGPVVETQSWVKNSRAGIEFGFHDEAAWIGLDETEFGKRPMVLTQIYLYGQHEAVRPYQEPLPFGLQLSADRVTVREQLAALESTRHSYVRDTWDSPDFRITVAFAEGDRSIDFVLCALREPPLPAMPYAIAPVPEVEYLIAALGRPLTDRALRDTFGALALQDRIEEINETGEADFRGPYGLALGFSAPIDAASRDSKTVVLSSVTLYQEREVDARGWPGKLPFGLRFDDSPETAVERVGRPPDIQVDDSFSGFAAWHESALTFHIFYDTIDNRILRVSLFAPGFWAKWHSD